MGRLVALILGVFLLCGCAAPMPDAEPTAPTQDPTAQIILQPVPMDGMTAYALEGSGADAIGFLGDNLLLIQSDGDTTLSLWDTGNLSCLTSSNLDLWLDPEDPMFRVTYQGVTYFDQLSRELVFLDPQLRQIQRIPLPESVTSPALSQNWKRLYYLSNGGLWELDLETNIHRIIREMTPGDHTIAGLHCSDTVIECTMADPSGTFRQVFYDVQTGQLLEESDSFALVTTWGSRYIAQVSDVDEEAILIGHIDAPAQVLSLSGSMVYPLPNRDALVTATAETEGIRLDHYHLATGTKSYSLSAPLPGFPRSLICDPTENRIWMLCDTASDSDLLLCWDPEKNPTGDNTNYLQPLRTAQNPDTEGLAQCADYARQLSEAYGIQILTWKDAVSTAPDDHQLEPEYRISAIMEALSTLEKALARFPEGFFRDVSAQMGDGTIRICLVRNIRGDSENNTVADPQGIQFWDQDFNAFICLQAQSALEQNFYHELYHVMESRIFSHSAALDVWNGLNPQDFNYTLSYANNFIPENPALLTGQTRAFIDAYAMRYPKEDRARIFEYAMLPGYSHFFASDTMQIKLQTLCQGIREGYELTESYTQLPWEQYLK